MDMGEVYCKGVLRGLTADKICDSLQGSEKCMRKGCGEV